MTEQQEGGQRRAERSGKKHNTKTKQENRTKLDKTRTTDNISQISQKHATQLPKSKQSADTKSTLVTVEALMLLDGSYESREQKVNVNDSVQFQKRNSSFLGFC